MIVREAAGFRHGDITVRLTCRLAHFVEHNSLGVVVAAETGFKLFSDPDTVRAADVAFVRADRVPSPPPEGFLDIAPDLAVEVLSPGDRPGDVLAKVSDWLSAGCRLVWVVDPRRRLVRAYRADGEESLVGGGHTLDGGDVVPGFSCRLSELF